MTGMSVGKAVSIGKLCSLCFILFPNLVTVISFLSALLFPMYQGFKIFSPYFQVVFAGRIGLNILACCYWKRKFKKLAPSLIFKKEIILICEILP